MKVIEIEGIGKKYAGKLGRAGCNNVEDLTELTYEQLRELANKTRISLKRLDKWQEQADLISLKGIGPEYAQALNKIGVDSAKELARRNAQNVLEKIKAFDKKQPNVIRKLPTLTQTKAWIEDAKKIYEIKKTNKTLTMNVIDIEGIGPKYAKSLKKANITTLEDLMKLTKAEIKKAAVKTKLSTKMIDKWQEHANLMRIDGIGPEFSDALNQIGIDSIKEFAKRTPQIILDKLKELDKSKPNVIRKIPTLADIKKWIAQAKKIR